MKIADDLVETTVAPTGAAKSSRDELQDPEHQRGTCQYVQLLVEIRDYDPRQQTAAERDQIVAGSAFLLQSNQTQSCSGGGAVTELGVEWSQTHAAGTSVEVGVEAWSRLLHEVAT